ncbi:MAG: hypothetical protein A6F71_02905 [Cycloclasticus sp. symbiont of Poecilosclerida sp. M]|nr:MAG: hypothetical protein A6F71_02905 [Cycloclasticus sp. symbiont of Poecilosclerida sp. M]
MVSAIKEAVVNKKTMVRWSLDLMLLIASVVYLSQWINNTETLPIKNIRIEGEFRYVSQQQLTEVLAASVQTGYFSMNSGKIITAAKSIQWVKDAKVRRVWPDTIVLSITEQKAVARWNKNSLINKEGEVFAPKFIEGLENLPHLYGANEQSQLVLSKFSKINNVFEKNGLAVHLLAKTEHGSWTAELKNGTQVLMGQVDPVEAMDKGLQVLALAESNVLQQIKVLDLRYPNGLSVVWRKGLKPKKLMIGKSLHGINQNEPKKG